MERSEKALLDRAGCRPFGVAPAGSPVDEPVAGGRDLACRVGVGVGAVEGDQAEIQRLAVEPHLAPVIHLEDEDPEHAPQVVPWGEVLEGRDGSLQSIVPIHHQNLRLRGPRRAYPHHGGGKRLATSVASGEAKEAGPRRGDVDEHGALSHHHAVVPAEAVKAGVQPIGGGRVAPDALAITRPGPPAHQSLTRALAHRRDVSGRLGRQPHRGAVLLGEVLDDALGDGPGGDVTKAGLFELRGVGRRVMKGHLEENGRRLRVVGWVQLTEVGRVDASVFPAWLVPPRGGPQICHQFAMNQLGQAVASRHAGEVIGAIGRVGPVDVRRRAHGCRVESVGVPGQEDRVFTCLVQPRGKPGAGPDVVDAIVHWPVGRWRPYGSRRPRELGVVPGRLLVARAPTDARPTGKDPHATADADRVERHVASARGGVVEDGNLGRHARAKEEAAQEDPSSPMASLIDSKVRLAPRVPNDVVGVAHPGGERGIRDVDVVVPVDPERCGEGRARTRRRGGVHQPIVPQSEGQRRAVHREAGAPPSGQG